MASRISSAIFVFASIFGLAQSVRPIPANLRRSAYLSWRSPSSASPAAAQPEGDVDGLDIPEATSLKFGWMQLKGIKGQTGQDEGMISFLQTKSTPQLTNMDDIYPQSFVTMWEKEHQVQLTLKKIHNYCLHREDKSTWLDCAKNKDGTYFAYAGTYGVALFAMLSIAKTHKVNVYKNSDMRKAAGPLTDINWESGEKILESFPLPIVVKMNTPNSEKWNELGYFPETTAIDKEVRHARAASKFKFPNGHLVTPEIYDIQDAETGKAHALHNFAYIQEQVQGAPAYDVLDQFIRTEKAAIEHNFRMTLDQFDLWLRTVKTQDQPKLRGRDNAASRAAESATAERYHQRFIEIADRASKEMWLRARARITLISFIYNTIRGVWGVMTHCDSHLGNIILVPHQIKTDEQLIRAKQDGATIILNPRIYLSQPDVSAAEMKELRAEGGVTIYKLALSSIKWIDSANAFPLKDVLAEIKASMKTSEPEKYLYSPCAMYREGMPEDFAEIFRLGADLALGGSNTDHTNLYRLARENLSRSSTAAKVYKLYEQSLGRYNAGQLGQSEIALRGDGQYLKIWAKLFPKMEQFKKEVADLTKVFKEAYDPVKNMELLSDCEAARLKAIASPEYRDIARGKHPWEGASVTAGAQCSLADMKQGVADILNILTKTAGKFRSYAPVRVFDSNVAVF